MGTLAGIGLLAATPLASPSAQEGPRSPAASAAGTPDAAGSRAPSFQSGGLKLTVVAASTTANAVTLSLILENIGRADVLVGLIGPVTGVAGGTTLNSQSIGGIAYCQAGGSRSDQITSCLAKDAPILPVQQLTLIEHGNTIPFNVTLNGGKVEKSQVLGIAMTAAVMPDDAHPDGSSAETVGAARGAKPAPGIPPRMRFISLGIPAVPLTE